MDYMIFKESCVTIIWKNECYKFYSVKEWCVTDAWCKREGKRTIQTPKKTLIGVNET